MRVAHPKGLFLSGRVTQILGFTLLEALVAFLIVSIGVLALAKLQGTLVSDSADSRLRSHAASVAQDKIEELRGFANQETYDNLIVGSSGSDTQNAANTVFTRSWVISDCPNTVNCKQIAMAVTWTDIKGQEQTINLTSYIAQTDPVKAGMVLVMAGSSSTSSSSTGSSSSGSSTSSTSSSTGSTSSSSTSSTTSSTTSSSTSSSSTSSSSSSSSTSSSGAVPASCTSPWGAPVAHGGSVSAYLAAAPTGACTSESRACDNGVLSGSYTQQSCLAGCSFAPGGAIASGSSVLAYQNASVPYNNPCTSETRLCTNGALSGSYTQTSCTVVCTVPNLVGMQSHTVSDRTAVDNAITAAGFAVGSKTDLSGGGANVVVSQTPAAGVNTCGASVSYSYRD